MIWLKKQVQVSSRLMVLMKETTVVLRNFNYLLQLYCTSWLLNSQVMLVYIYNKDNITKIECVEILKIINTRCKDLKIEK